MQRQTRILLNSRATHYLVFIGYSWKICNRNVSYNKLTVTTLNYYITRAAASTRVLNYSSNFLLLKYSLISISGCKFPFPVAVFGSADCSQLMNCWNLWKLGALRSHLQLAKLPACTLITRG